MINITDHFADKMVEYEFGGPIGVSGIILGSHGMMFYLLWCLESAGNTDFSFSTWIPDAFSVATYLCFLLFEGILAVTLTGVQTKGLPLPPNKKKEDKVQLNYLCNG